MGGMFIDGIRKQIQQKQLFTVVLIKIGPILDQNLGLK